MKLPSQTAHRLKFRWLKIRWYFQATTLALMLLINQVVFAKLERPKILFLGDSITHGRLDRQSYRYPLWKLLASHGQPFEFVGSQTSNHDGSPPFPDLNGQSFINRHEGHYGWRADQILEALPSWLSSYTPDIVILQIGSNDIGAGDSVVQIASEVSMIIARLRQANPSVSILLTNGTPTTGNRRVGHTAMKNEYTRTAERENTQVSKVYLVDTFSGFNSFFLADSVHPNERGEDYIARRIYPVLVSALQEK
ncbi:SGNH/GDSL hydrolase family protein [Muricoccus vinaceus]|uniref:SGNH/GDSL hydrolase family protein n=1 Tax=Muricoccus vinaceus TaxID=424704 RepID=A0ABV6IU28_9PROT